MKKKIKLMGFVMWVLLGNISHALQELTVQDQEKVEVMISNRDMNRIAFVNDQIKYVYGAMSFVNLQKEEENGQIFLRTRLKEMKPFTLTLITASGATVDLKIKQDDRESETILLDLDKRSKVERAKGRSAKQNMIKGFISSALRGVAIKGFRMVAHEISKKSNNNGLVQKKSYIGAKYKILVFDYTNQKGTREIISEEMFKTPSCIAVLIAKKVLNASEISKVIVVEKNEQIKYLRG